MISDRNKNVLFAVINSYIMKAEPVGSRFVTKAYPFNLSPATIRNIMSDLEEMGYLMHPHTSAGRVPTDKGYRFYVDALSQEHISLDADILNSLRKRFELVKRDVGNLFREATRAVSELSHNLVFAIPVRPETTTLNRIQLYQYRRKKIVAVILTNEGLVTNKLLETDFGLTQKELNKISDYLNSEFAGSTIDGIKSELIRQMSEERRKCDILILRAVRLCNEALEHLESDFIVSGFSELVRLPGFADKINLLAKAIEDKHKILKLLERLNSSDGMKIIIGSENPERMMQDLSIIMTEYRQCDKLAGSVGMIGPKSMDYSKAIPMVDRMAEFISEMISR